MTNLGNLDILTVDTPHSGKLRTRGAPDGRSGALFERLEIASFGHGFSGRDKTRLVIARQAIASEFLVCHVAAEICQDSARMNGEGTNFTGFATLIKFDSRRIEKVCVAVPVSQVAELTMESYQPGAGEYRPKKR